MGTVDAELDDAIESLYRVFAHYPLRPSTEPCLHCHEPVEERALHEHLLRELSAEDLSGFAGEVLMVWGREVDFKHFLPRIMEITVAQDNLDWPDIESVFGRLAYARWHEWPAGEQDARWPPPRLLVRRPGPVPRNPRHRLDAHCDRLHGRRLGLFLGCVARTSR